MQNGKKKKQYVEHNDWLPSDVLAGEATEGTRSLARLCCDGL